MGVACTSTTSNRPAAMALTMCCLWVRASLGKVWRTVIRTTVGEALTRQAVSCTILIAALKHVVHDRIRDNHHKTHNAHTDMGTQTHIPHANASCDAADLPTTPEHKRENIIHRHPRWPFPANTQVTGCTRDARKTSARHHETIAMRLANTHGRGVHMRVSTRLAICVVSRGGKHLANDLAGHVAGCNLATTRLLYVTT